MKQVKAENLYLLYDGRYHESQFYVGSEQTKMLIDIHGQTKINNDKEKLAQKELYLRKVWKPLSYVEDSVFATLEGNYSPIIRDFLIEGLNNSGDASLITKAYDISKKLYSVKELSKIENLINEINYENERV